MKDLIFIIISLLLITHITSPKLMKVKVLGSTTTRESISSGKPITTKERTAFPSSIPTPSVKIIKPTIEPVSNETNIINSKKHASIIWQIYQGESGMGMNDVCRHWGEYNGLGWDEYTGHHPTCFQTFDEVVSHVEAWIEDKLDRGFSLAELHCYYVQGRRVSNCNTSYSLSEK